MNEQLRSFARETILTGLRQVRPHQQRVFRLMYARNEGKRSVEDAEAMPLEDVVMEIPDNKLDWAMVQIERTLTE